MSVAMQGVCHRDLKLDNILLVRDTATSFRQGTQAR
jgi:hypothetical protein